MKNSSKHPIIANGEYYVEPLKKRFGLNNPKFPHEYNDAKLKLSRDIDMIQNAISNETEVFLDEKILCVRLEPKYEAKSYTPTALLSDSKMKLIGGRKYTLDSVDSELDDCKGKLYFIRANDMDLEKLKENFTSHKKDNTTSWKNQICTIKSIDLLDPDEKILGFDSSWQEGTVEVVIHPLGDMMDSVINSFFQTAGIKKEEATVRSYDDGLTFVCTYMNRENIEKAKKFNPLRSIKPLYDDIEEPYRTASMTAPAPLPPLNPIKSNIKIGVFDGGIPNEIALLKPFVTNYDMVEAPPTSRSQEHGCAVCGAVLYGSLSDLTPNDRVTQPAVSVESFRVFPTLKSGDYHKDDQMYSTIDIIEEVVKHRTDIKIFNLSFGPKGAILDDELSRFTYVCDKLTYEVEEGDVNPLFCIAVGNQGTLFAPFNRIQSPADMVNGLAVGAYSYNSLNEKIRASYSCIGPGREGAKIKPDILEFGGDMQKLFFTVWNQSNMISVEQGTSFAAPVVAGKIGKLVGSVSKLSPHLARTLLIHNAECATLEGTCEEGFGFCPENVEEILNCSDNSVTILYEGEITSSTSVKLPIYLPEIAKYTGNISLKWTICTVVNPNVNDPDAYTNNCIEDTLYPHDMTFNFTKGRTIKKLNLLAPGKIEEAGRLMDEGYIRSELPVPKPAKKSFSENELRNSDFKWDTVIRKHISMRASSLCNPFLSLHAIGRDEYEHEKIRYFVVITIDAPRYVGSLYDNILQQYEFLAPIKIQTINRIQAENDPPYPVPTDIK